MNLGDLEKALDKFSIGKLLSEFDKALGALGLGFVVDGFQFLFYPPAFDKPVSNVTQVANLMGCDECRVFEIFGTPGYAGRDFDNYFRTGEVPPWVKQKCRNYLRDHSSSS